jgi:hypothetical protein
MSIDPDLLNDDLGSAMGTETLLTMIWCQMGFLPLVRGLLDGDYTILEGKISGSRPNRGSASRFEGVKDLAIWNGAARPG